MKVLRYPNKNLETIAVDVTVDEIESSSLRDIVNRMFATMLKQKGIGLAATQVGLNKRFFVIDTTKYPNGRKAVFFNPKITGTSGDMSLGIEGCLSFDKDAYSCPRYTKIFIEALNSNGSTIEMELTGVSAIVFQHELDHLNGITMDKVGIKV